MKNKQAFTLIELLVVVLIIGILAAVALPQYNKAAEKARATEGLTALKSIAAANKAYYMANGEYATDINALDIEIPGTKTTTNLVPRTKTQYFEHGTAGSDQTLPIIALANRLPVGHFYLFVQLENNIRCCYGYSTKGIQICKSLTNNQTNANYPLRQHTCYQL